MDNQLLKATAASLDELAIVIHETAWNKGFYEGAPDTPIEVGDPSWRPAKLALVHSEVSEALEALRNGDAENYVEELADIIIRVLDLAEFDGLEIGHAVVQKMFKNMDRPRLHGRKF